MQWLPDSPFAPAVVAIAAVALMVIGRRGRRVNDHPICRRCGFDLVGRPADSTTCSECGADLLRRRAVRQGQRRRVRGAVSAGLLLLLPSLALLGYQGYESYAAVPAVQRKPVWWLVNDAASPDPVMRGDAFDELTRRLRGGRLSASHVEQVVARALEIQGDPRRLWFPQWGDFVEEAYKRGAVPAERWRQYVGQAPQFELVATEQFRRGGPAWLELVEKPSRVGARQEFVLRVHRRLTITDARGTPVRRDFGPVICDVGGLSRLRGGWSLPLNEGVIGRLADGRHEARLEMVVEILAGREASNRPAKQPPVATIRRELHTAWLVEPASSAAPDSGVAVGQK